MDITMLNTQFVSTHLIYGLHQTEMLSQGCYSDTEEQALPRVIFPLSTALADFMCSPYAPPG